MSHTVLVCDDTMFMRNVISSVLSEAGYEIVGEAENGAQAVERYTQLKPDLVTMDIVMPDITGIEAVQEIATLDPDARILMCSAIDQQPLARQAVEAGARAYVVKPFQPHQLLEAAERALA
jgi:two-component system chemotaxis response regulator CheY